MKKSIPNQEKEFVVPAPKIQSMLVEIKGTAPLIFHKWSDKAKRMIIEKQMKKASAGRDIRNPGEEYRSSFYYDKDGYIAFPALSLKQAIINAVRSIEGLAMTQVRGSIFVLGDEDGLIQVTYKGKPIKLSELKLYKDGQEKPENLYGFDKKLPDIVQMRQDMVRIGMGSADIRFRGQVKNWSMKFVLKFNAGLFSPEQVLNLLQYAGFSCGLGEWRPERSGDYGTFELSK